MKSFFVFILVFASCATGLLMQPAKADSNTQASIINGHAFQNAKGVVRINMAAGSGNVQANVGSILLGSSGVGGAFLWQTTAGSGVSDGGTLTALIEGQAFSGINGLLQINQASGSGNLEANIANMASVGVSGSGPLTPVVLGQQYVPVPPGEKPDSESGSKTVFISSQAFDHANGVLQVSQAAGSGNRLANIFSLNIQGVVP